MSKCLIARTAVVNLRQRGKPAEQYTLVFPHRWSRSDLLRYVRQEHPECTVKLVEWGPTADPDTWKTKMWLANPAGFADYARGIK